MIIEFSNKYKSKMNYSTWIYSEYPPIPIDIGDGVTFTTRIERHPLLVAVEGRLRMGINSRITGKVCRNTQSIVGDLIDFVMFSIRINIRERLEK